MVKPDVKNEDTEEQVEAKQRPEKTQGSPKKHIYPCIPCNKKFEDRTALEQHQQTEHFECDNCFKFFSHDHLENHKAVDEKGNKICTVICTICGDNPTVVFTAGEAFVDHMNEKHRSIVGVNWFQCVHCLKLNKRYFNRYYPTKKSLQLHMAVVHGQQNHDGLQRVMTAPTSVVESPIVVKNDLSTLNTVYSSTSNSAGEIYVPINAIANNEGTSASSA